MADNDVEALRRVLDNLVHRTPFSPSATGIDLHLTFEQIAEHQRVLAATKQPPVEHEGEALTPTERRMFEALRIRRDEGDPRSDWRAVMYRIVEDSLPAIKREAAEEARRVLGSNDKGGSK